MKKFTPDPYHRFYEYLGISDLLNNSVEDICNKLKSVSHNMINARCCWSEEDSYITLSGERLKTKKELDAEIALHKELLNSRKEQAKIHKIQVEKREKELFLRLEKKFGKSNA